MLIGNHFKPGLAPRESPLVPMDGGDFVLNPDDGRWTVDVQNVNIRSVVTSVIIIDQSLKEQLCCLNLHQVQTIIREVSADLETPVSLYLKLRGDGASFLLESVEGGERIARYSFIGVQPRAEYILRDGQVEIKENGETRTVQLDNDDPTLFLQNEMNRFPAVRLPNAPRFTGGLVGYLGYEFVRFFEPTLKSENETRSNPRWNLFTRRYHRRI